VWHASALLGGVPESVTSDTYLVLIVIQAFHDERLDEMWHGSRSGET
jgi:hypothetical protein